MLLKKLNIPLLLGFLYGLVYSSKGVSELRFENLSATAVEGLYLMSLLPLALALLQKFTRHYVDVAFPEHGPDSKFLRYEPYTYLVFLLAGGFYLGIKPNMAFTWVVLAALLLSQLLLFFFTLDKVQRQRLVASEKYVAVLFLVSGFSALIYQVVWQRALFTAFGVNSESVTVIVSVFMFGLGVGALAGGYVQRHLPNYLLHLFLLLEVAIGLFGLVSLDVIRMVSELAGSASPIKLVFWVYVVLAVPTLAMGATLPVLVAFLQRHLRNIGGTVGILYAFNTFGSAIAAFCTVQILFVLFGLQMTVYIAAACNFSVVLLIYDAATKLRKGPTQPEPAPIAVSAESQATSGAVSQLPFGLAFAMLALVGYISLSQEILWFRLLGFLTANKPQVFGMMLAAFLLGIGVGALKSKAVCESQRDPVKFLLVALAIALVVFYLSTPVLALITSLMGKQAGMLFAYVAIAAVAGLTGSMLPVLIHLGTANQVGEGSTLSVAWLYFANIVGATLGPLLTGFFLLDLFSLKDNIAILSLISVLLLLVLLSVVSGTPGYKIKSLLVCSLALLLGWGGHDVLYRSYLEKIQYASTDFAPFKYVQENRGGILTVEADNPDTMFGNGIYDGKFNTDPVSNGNRIARAYMVAALHREPRKILEIGLSTASWSRVLSQYAPLQSETIIEINPGYPAIANHYPESAAALRDPKVDVTIDDARRWLRNHPDKKFDFIIMNTSFYWRSNTTSLLSREFLELCRRHLNPGGVMYFNTTGLQDSIFTTAHVFKHVTVFDKSVAGSDAPFDMSTEEKRANLLRFQRADGSALFAHNGGLKLKLEELATFELTDIRESILKRKDLQLTTDDNMVPEYKVD